MKKISLVIAASFLLLGALTIVTYDVPIEQKDFINFQKEYKEYTLTPEIWSGQNVQIPSPYVNVAPTEFFYFWSKIKEDIDILFNKQRPLYFTPTIIAELNKWGNIIPIQDDSVSWYSMFNRYSQLIEKELTAANNQDKKAKYERLKEVKNYLNSQKQELEYIVHFIDKTENTKQSLISSIEGMFFQLNKKIPHLYTSQPIKLVYLLTPVFDEQEYGIYKLIINTEDIPNYVRENLILKTNDDKIATEEFSIDSPSQILTIELPDDKSIENKEWREEIKKDETDPFIYHFDIPISKYEKGQDYHINLTYNFDTPVTLKLEQQYSRVLKDKKSKKKKIIKGNDTLVNTLLLPTKENKTLQKVIRFSADIEDSNYGDVGIFILSKKSLSDKIQDTTIKLSPLYAPSITMEKIDDLPEIESKVTYEKIRNDVYSIKFSNTSIDQQNYILSSLGLGWKITSFRDYSAIAEFIPGRVIYLFVLSSITFILNIYYLLSKYISKGKKNWIDRLISKRLWIGLFKLIAKISFSPFAVFSNIFFKICKKYRASLFILALLFILLDIFFFKSTSNFIKFLVLLVWIYTSHAYFVEVKVTFITALISIALSALLLIFQNEFAAEKSAIWAYLLLTVGVGQWTYQLKSSSQNQLDIFNLRSTIIKESSLIRITVVFYKYFKSMFMPKFKLLLIKIFGFTYFFITRRVVNPHPKNKFDVFLNIIRLVLFFVVSSLVIYVAYIGAVSVNNKIQAEFRKKTRLAKNAQIKKIQPYLVYHATKVIINGRNFGWKDEKGARLMSQYGEVITEPWTDTKLIFTVPLGWKPGIVNLWIEKPVLWENKYVTTKSDIITIKLLSTGSSFNQDDDEFFEQLKKLDKEVLEINGYSLEK